MESSGADTAHETDADLLRRSRDGDRRAFSELWRRHAPTAVAYARSLGTAPPDPEDVVSDAFLSILQLVRAGRGPEERFRPYLLTTVRNTWLTAARRAPSTVPLDEVEEPPSGIGTIDVEAMMNSAALVEAFGALPERWQHALWLSEVEHLPPREIADVLGMRANAVAALTYRARDGLRKAWIGAHLRRAAAGSDHRRVIELLGAYVQGDLGPRPQKFVAAHLESCADCRAAAGEARHLARAITLGPLLVGGAGLVIAPAFFPTAQAAAAVGYAAPVLWPVAAAVAVALSIGGSLLVRTPTEPDATAVVAPAVALPPPAASAPEPAASLPAPTTPTVATIPATDPDRPVTGDDAARVPHITPPATSPPTADGHAGAAAAAPTDDDEAVAPNTFMTKTASATWYVEVSIELDPADPDCIPIAHLSVGGTAGAVVAIVVDGRVAGKAGELDGYGIWSGDLVLPSTGGEHTVSLHLIDEDGSVGEVAVQTVIEY